MYKTIFRYHKDGIHIIHSYLLEYYIKLNRNYG